MSILNNQSPISKNSSDQGIQALLKDLQGNILKSHARPEANIIFLEFQKDVEEVKEWIRTHVVPGVTSMASQLSNTLNFKNNRRHVDPGFMSFSLTNEGYRFFGINAGALNDPSFNAGMKSGTIGADPSSDLWEDPYQNSIHAVIIMANNELLELTNAVSTFQGNIPKSVRILQIEKGSALPNEKEHFGFADGRSQPKYFQDDLSAANEPSTTNWNPFASLNLVLTPDPFGTTFSGANSTPIDSDGGDHSFGSYLVFRKLEQDVSGWNREVLSISQQTGISPDLVGAYAVGRFQDGTPVINHSSSSPTNPIENDFDYSNDPSGQKCPFHAHIRKTNPRGESPGGIGFDRDKVRITRRGIPYGDPNSSEPKGLLFMCYQSNIKRQFDFMQNAWADNDNFLNPGTGTDSVIGQGNSSQKAWPNSHGGSGSSQQAFNQFVHMKGGEYFFTPSISFLKTL